MVMDALRAYAQIATGLTDVTRERAVAAAKALIAQVGVMSEGPAASTAQVRALADELTKAARTNRDVVVGMIRSETERTVASLGLASADEVVALRRRVVDLETRLAAAQTTAARTEAAATTPVRTETGTANTGTANTGTAKTASTKTGTAKTNTAKTGAANTATATTATAKTGTAKAAAKKAATAKKTAKKATATTSPPSDAPAASDGSNGPTQDPSPPDVSTS